MCVCMCVCVCVGGGGGGSRTESCGKNHGWWVWYQCMCRGEKKQLATVSIAFMVIFIFMNFLKCPHIANWC